MTLPRQDPFTEMAPGLPPDGRGWVQGDHRTLDKSDDLWGRLHSYGPSDTGLLEDNPNDSVLSWFAWRFAAPANTRVKTQAFWRPETGDPLPVKLGLMTRLQSISGSQTASGVPRWFDADAYTMEIAVGPTVTLEIARINQGLRTLLVTTPVPEFLEGRLYEVEFEAVDEGANVRLRALIDGVEIANHVDVTPIVGGGFYGWLGNAEISGTAKTRTGMRYFEAYDGALIHREDFDRPNLFSPDARYGLWHSSLLARPVAGALSASPTEDVHAVDLFQVLPNSQDLSAAIDYTARADLSSFGVLVRASKADALEDLAGLTGYAVVAMSGQVEIRKYISGDLIDSVAQSFVFTPGISYRVEAAVSGDASVLVQARIDTVDVVAFTDSTSSRIRQGLTGLIGYRDSLGPLEADNWDLQDGPDTTVPPTVVVPAASDASIEDLPYAFGALPVGARDGKRWFTLPFVANSEDEVLCLVEGMSWRRRPYPSTLLPGEYQVDVAGGRIGFQRAIPDDWDVRIDGNKLGQSALTFVTLTGAIDGVNKTFTTSIPAIATPSRARVYGDGLRKGHTVGTPPTGRFRWVGTTLTMGDAPWERVDMVVPTDDLRPELKWGIEPTPDPAGTVLDLGFRPNSLGQVYPAMDGVKLLPAVGVLGADRFSSYESKLILGDAKLSTEILVVDALECGAYLERLPVDPSDPSSEIWEFYRERLPSPDGYVQSFPVTTGHDVIFPLAWNSLPGIQYRDLIDFLARHNGPEHEFEWIPNGQTVPIRCALKSFDDGKAIDIGRYLGQETTIHNVRATLRAV